MAPAEDEIRRRARASKIGRPGFFAMLAVAAIVVVVVVLILLGR